MRTDETLWHDVMDRLATMAVTFIDVQLSHGAQAFQLFDSWAGALSRADYERFVLPHSRRVFAELAARHPTAPGIHFGIGCDHLLESMWTAGPRIIGLDWRTSIQDARRRLGPDVVVQGNLDPALVLAGEAPATDGDPRGARRQRRPPRPRLQPRSRRPPRLGPRRAGCDRRPGPRRDRHVTLHARGLRPEPHRRPARWRSLGRPVMGDAHDRRRAVDGLRHAPCARADRDLLHRHPPRPPADGRAAGRPDPALRGHRWHVAPGGTDRSPARRPAAGARRQAAWPVRRADRAQARRPEDRGRSRCLGARTGGPGRRPRAGAALLGAVGR